MGVARIFSEGEHFWGRPSGGLGAKLHEPPREFSILFLGFGRKTQKLGKIEKVFENFQKSLKKIATKENCWKILRFLNENSIEKLKF